MQLEVILPLVAYLLVVFGLSVYAMRKRVTGTFLNEYFLGSFVVAVIGALVVLFIYRKVRS